MTNPSFDSIRGRLMPTLRPTGRALPWCLCLPLLLAGVGTCQAADEATQAPAGGLTIKWDGLLQLRAERLDGVYGDVGDAFSGAYLRRASLGVSGHWRRQWLYKLKAEVTDNDQVRLKTATLGYAGQPYGTWTIGRFDPEFGLERTGSSASTTAIERSAIWDLAPSAGEGDQGVGASFTGSGRWHHVSAAAVQRQGTTALSTRLVAQPSLGRNQVLHIGVSWDDQRVGRSDGRIRTRLGSRGTSLFDEGNRTTLALADDGQGFDADRTLGLELAYQAGPYSVQAEGLQRRLSGTGLREGRVARGYYVQLAWTMTGERRRYIAEDARFANPRPRDARWGAWELFYRYDRLGVNGEIGVVRPLRSASRADLHVLGVNWYLGRQFKVGANLLLSDTVGVVNNVGDSRGRAVSLQGQYDF